MILTVTTIKAMKPGAAPYRVSDVGTPGLALRVAPSGEMTWDVAFRVKGAGVRRQSLGRYSDVTLEAARIRADELTSAARKGVDLIAKEREERDAKARAMNVAALIDLYLARRVKPRLRSACEVERVLNRVLAPLARMPAADVRRRDLLPLFEKIAASGYARAAGKARILIGSMFKWAEQLDIVSSDPTRGMPTYDQGTPRERVLDEDEIRTLWAWLDALPPAMGDALRVQLLTGARIGEVSGMRIEEIDREKWLWRLPEARSKNEHSRVTPLVGMARTIIEARMDDAVDGHLFVTESGRPLKAAHVATALYKRRANCRLRRSRLTISGARWRR